MTVAVAASLEHVDVGGFERIRPVDLAVASGSSAALRTQVEQGAAFSVFLSADLEQPRLLVEAGLGEPPVVPFAHNRLALVVPAHNPGRITGPADLGRAGVRIVAAAEGVPVTGYVRLLLSALSRLPGYPPGFETAYLENVVSREDSVAAVLAKVALGEADAGLVYATDARRSRNVAEIVIPADANPLTTMGAVVIAQAGDRSDARAFLAWLIGPGGRAELGRQGFLLP